jgi:hypothetical protein
MVSSVNGEEAFAIASRGLDHDYTAIGPTLAAALTALAEKVRDA